MNKLFQFGEEIPGYDYRVINERDARASAGIMFLFGIISFFSFILTRNLFWAELFSLTFILEFMIRVFVNPLYAPYMVLGSMIVANQQPEWVEAKPKKFAWILGLGLGLMMAYFIVFGVLSPIRMLTCVACLILLFTESVFGICLGCMVYKKFNVDLQNCPGGVCDTPLAKRGSMLQRATVIVLFGLLSFGMYHALKSYKYNDFKPQLTLMETEDLERMIASVATEKPVQIAQVVTNMTKPQTEPKGEKECTPPKWAVAMGHKELWKKHNGCK
jgi:hypothetical protein